MALLRSALSGKMDTIIVIRNSYMKVRIYDSRLKGYVDRYTFYFPYPKKRVEAEMKRSGHQIMGICQPFSFRTDQSGKTSLTFCPWFDDDRTLNINVPNNEKKLKIESMPKEVQEYATKMEKLWNDAWKYDDEEHWKKWNLS